MKLSEMNARQRLAYANIVHAANWIIGGLENVLLDYAEDDSEYVGAKQRLDDHDGLVREIYDAAIRDLYEEDGCSFGSGAESLLKQIRFCGKDWLMERVERRVRKLGH